MREGRLNCCQIDGRREGRNLAASFRAKDWIDSREWKREVEEGSQMAEQYSRCGRTRDLYSFMMVEGDE